MEQLSGGERQKIAIARAMAQNYISFNIANVRNVVNDLEVNGIQVIEEEKFVALGEDTDIIIMDSAAVKNIIPLYQEDDAMFDTCKAWQNGEVFLQMAYNAYYTNYEIALINTWFIAKTVYPDLFDDIDITEKTNYVEHIHRTHFNTYYKSDILLT